MKLEKISFTERSLCEMLKILNTELLHEERRARGKQEL